MKLVRESTWRSVRQELSTLSMWKTLGTYYADDHLLVRLEKIVARLALLRKNNRVRLFVEMTTYLSDHNKAGFEHWAKLNNLKEAVRTFNYLSEHNLLNYEDFKNHVADSADAIQATESKIQSLNKQLDAQRSLQKRCDVYRHCRTVLLC
ncbi:MAG: hypothetical protein ACLTER_01755 [Ruminococcus sp.]